MLRLSGARAALSVLLSAMALALAGCTSLSDYVHNGFKVGPNYCPPAVPLPEHWIDEADAAPGGRAVDLTRWWAVFHDPVLDNLIACAYQQNLTLREAAFRILQARAQLAIARGDLFPQFQDMTGSYARIQPSLNPPLSVPFVGKRANNQWALGFGLAWEIDFWGRFRRAIASQQDLLEASVADYDQVLVTLLADVAANYIQLRTLQRQIEATTYNAEYQRLVADILEKRMRGKVARPADVEEALALEKQTEALVPQLQIQLRQAANQLCILLGMPVVDLEKLLSPGPIPFTPNSEYGRSIVRETSQLLARLGKPTPGEALKSREAIRRYRQLIAEEEAKISERLHDISGTLLTIPADVLRQRPDVRRAERQAAAQAEQIGIAQAELYPFFTINGNLGWQAKELPYLFSGNAFTGSVGPSFQWNILQYGRLINNVRFQDARFQELAVAYQQSVLQADVEVEDGMVLFLRSQEQARLLGESVSHYRSALADMSAILGQGGFPAGGPVGGTPFSTGAFTQYVQIAQNVTQQENQEAQAQGQIALGLIQVYRAMGGGWEIRNDPQGPGPCIPLGHIARQSAEPIPTPAPAAGQPGAKAAEPAPAVKELPGNLRFLAPGPSPANRDGRHEPAAKADAKSDGGLDGKPVDLTPPMEPSRTSGRWQPRPRASRDGTVVAGAAIPEPVASENYQGEL